MIRRAWTLVVTSLFSLAGLAAQTSQGDDVRLFPTSGEAWVGDPMPFFDDGVLWIYFLEDLRSNAQGGYHPVGLMTSSDLSHYQYHGIVVPFGASPRSQDRAIGTGSVVKDTTGLYHFFYTGHNDFFEPKEAILHAVSQDRVHWTKLANEVFFAPEKYSSDDFRDPYVFYNQEDGRYWMLITTRQNDRGVLVLQTSTDLCHWSDEGVFFGNDLGTDSNMECPSLLFYAGFWYLSFSDQWPDRVVHYRVSRSSRGPFVNPQRDQWDGSGFYAGRLVADEKDLYVIGWAPTRAEYRDTGPLQWGGSLVAHRLVPQVDGTLVPAQVRSAASSIATREVLADSSYRIVGGRGSRSLGELSGTLRLEGSIRTDSLSGRFGFTFGIRDETGAVTIAFEPGEGRICSYNIPIENANAAPAESSVPWNPELGKSTEFTLLVDGSVGVLYLAGQTAFTFRSFSMQDRPWNIFNIGGAGEFAGLKIFR